MKLARLAFILLLGTSGATGLRAQATIVERDALGATVKRHCQAAQWPKRIPPLDSVVDSAALAASIATLPGSDTSGVLFTIVYLEDGSSAVRVVGPDTLPADLETSFTAIVGRTVRPQALEGRLAALRLRLSKGQFTVARSVYCPPVLAPGNGVLMRSTSGPIYQEDRLPSGGRQRIVLDLHVSIDDLGHVTEVRVISGSGLRDLDDELVNDAYKRLYLPAMIDGVRIKSWVRTNGTWMRP